MKAKLINSAEDMKWLRDVHLPGLPDMFLSAVIEGNEDSPNRIDCYHSLHPMITDSPVTYWPVEGIYVPYYD